MINPEKLKIYQQDPVAFLEDHYYLNNGKKIQVENWQKKEIFDPIFKTKDEQGFRKYNLGLIGLPRKNGKSTLSSGIALHALFCWGSDIEITSIANDKEQAGLIFDFTKKAILRNPLLKNSTEIFKWEVKIPQLGNVYRVREADSVSMYGLGSNLYLYDELGWAKDRKLWDAISTSQGHLKEPLIIVTSTAGDSTTGILHELYQQALKGEDKRLFMFWSEKNLASWITEEYLEQQRRRLPPIVFQRLHENRWTGGEGAFITREDLNRCVDMNLSPQLSGKQGISYFLACDLGLVKDRTAIAITHRDENFIYLDSLRVWEGSNENPVSISDIEEHILESSKAFRNLKVILDPWQLKGTAQKLSSILSVEEFSFSSSNLYKLSSNLYYLLHNGLLKLYHDEKLEQELLELNAVNTNYGWKLDHKSSGFSDRAIALGMSVLFSITSKKQAKASPEFSKRKDVFIFDRPENKLAKKLFKKELQDPTSRFTGAIPPGIR